MSDSSENTPEQPTTNGSWLRRLGIHCLRIGCALLLCYLLLCVVAMFFENSLLYFPLRYPEGMWNPQGLNYEDARFQAADGTRLHGWYIPNKNAKGAVLLCHGNGGNLTFLAPMLILLRDRAEVSVLAFDYRGYGRSEGTPSEAGLYADARAARAWLAKREGISESDVILMGESLGGAVAVDLAASDGARALILKSTFNRLPDVAAHHYPFLPVRWAIRSQFNSEAKIPNYHGSLLQVHGKEDTIVPFQFGRRLFDAANEPKRFITLPNGDHNDSMPPDFFDAIKDLLEKHPGGR